MKDFCFYLSFKSNSLINPGPDPEFKKTWVCITQVFVPRGLLCLPSSSSSSSSPSHAFISLFLLLPPHVHSVTLVEHSSVKQCIIFFINTIITIIIISIIIIAFLLTVVALMRAGFLKASSELTPPQCFWCLDV